MSLTQEPLQTTHKDIDLSARSFWAKSPEERDAAFAVLRAENPVPWSRPPESDLLPPEENLAGFWSLTKYEDIQYASRAPEIFSSAAGVTMEDFTPEMVEMSHSFIAMDDPRHAELRGIVMDAFKPRNMRKLEAWVFQHARELVDEMAPRGEGDFVQDIAIQLPGRIFASFFGLPEGELADKAVAAGQRMLSWPDPEVCAGQSGLELFADGIVDLYEVVQEVLPERQANPGDDLLSWIITAETNGKRLTDEEIQAVFVLMAIAANDTTRHATAQAIYSLSKFPDQKALLLSNIEENVPLAVEEALRCVHPLLHMRRTALQDVEIRGAQIKKGDKVVLWYASGNRDEDIFENPTKFDITRSPNPHMTFGGGGPHYCLGAALARTMLKAVLTEVYTRIPDIDAPEPNFLVANFINGIKSLPATWTPETTA
jgi:cytochrome P450